MSYYTWLLKFTLLFYYSITYFIFFALGMSELLNCMRAEGSPDSCITFFTTGNGKEICMKELMKKMMNHVGAWDLNWGKCSRNEQALKR